MPFVVTSDDIAAAIGLPFASTTDEDWARLCADGTNSYIAGLPIASDASAEPQVREAAVMLAVDAYHRRPNGAIAPDFSGETLLTGAAQSLWPVVNRLLRLGQHEHPWVA